MKYKLILKIIILIISISGVSKLLSLEKISIPLFSGKIIFYSFFANVLKVLFTIIIICITIFIIKFIDANIDQFIKRKPKYFEYKHLKFKDKSEKKNVLKTDSKILEKIKKSEEGFDEEFFLHHAKSIFLKIQKDALINHIKNLRDTWECAGEYVNYVYDNKIIYNNIPQFYFYNNTSDVSTVKVVIKTNIVYHALELQNMNFININRNKVAETFTIMTFMKWKKGKRMNCPNCGAPMESNEKTACKYCMKHTKIHIDNIEIKDLSLENNEDNLEEIYLTNCLKCGAPLKPELEGKCEYCGVLNNTEQTDWVLTNVEDVKNLDYYNV